MKKREKKKLTTKQEQTKYRSLQYAAIGGAFASILAPFVILGGINFQDWFMSEGGYKVGIGATLGLAVAGVALFFITQKKEKELKVTDGWITFMVCFLALTVAVKLIANIYDELFGIMIWTFVGIAHAFGFDMLSKAAKRRADAYKNARAKVQEETIEERAKREVEEEQAQATE